MHVIKKFDGQSIAIVYAYFLALVGFVGGLFIAIANIINVLFAGDFTLISILITVVFNLLIGVLVGLISGILGLIVGYITGYVFSWLYNKAIKHKLLAGIKMELKNTDDK